jgi:hypothetical protein
VVRIEAFSNMFTETVNGTENVGQPIQAFVPTTAPPTFSVISIGSATVSQQPMASLTVPDVTISSSSPVQLTVRTSGIPVGTVLKLRLFSENTASAFQTFTTTPLIGTLQSATTTATVTFPGGWSLAYLKSTW